MKSNSALDTHSLVTKVASYLDILGGIIIIVFAITAVFSLPALLSGTNPLYNLMFTMTPASGVTPASSELLYSFGFNMITGASFDGLSTTAIIFSSEILSSAGVSTTGPLVTDITLSSLQFGGGMIIVGITLILGILGMVAGFVSRKNSRIGGVIAFIVIIALLFVGFTNLGVIGQTGLELMAIVPLLGIGIIGVGGVLGLAISEL
jgi:hypothetical protein